MRDTSHNPAFPPPQSPTHQLSLDNAHYAYYIIIMKDKELLSLLKKNGWRVDRINGSHHILVKGNKTISLPVHGADMKTGLENAILKQAGLK